MLEWHRKKQKGRHGRRLRLQETKGPDTIDNQETSYQKKVFFARGMTILKSRHSPESHYSLENYEAPSYNAAGKNDRGGVFPPVRCRGHLNFFLVW
jgi:hypothetical protein